MQDTVLSEFRRELERFETAMLVTRRGDELRSRPMSIAGVSGEGHVWFMTSIDSTRLEEIAAYPSVNVALLDSPRFMSISGTVHATRDREAVRTYWNDTQSVWFTHGHEDPELILLEVVPTYAEYWDRSGTKGVRFKLPRARATLLNETMTDEETRNGKVDFTSAVGNASAELSETRS